MKYDAKMGVFVLDDKFFVDRNGLRYYLSGNCLNSGNMPISPFAGEDDEEIANAEKFVLHLRKRTTINKQITSYGLKHEAERYLRRTTLAERPSEAYISNGAFIVAMLANGFIYRKWEMKNGEYSLSVMFNISRKGIR